jgi:16S rRNA G966 N2-methylase RsmD
MQDTNSRVVNLFGRDFSAMSAHQQAFWLGKARRYWREQGFPYPTLTTIERKREFSLLRSVKPNSIVKRNLIAHSTVGLRLANAFHPQMWRVRAHGRSPVELFGDDQSLTRALRKAAGFWPDRRCWNAQCLRSVLRIMHRVGVSNFRPTVARALLQRYSGEGDAVLDFSAGYGGRLLGALSLERHYTGVDPDPAQFSGLNALMEAMSGQSLGNSRLIRGCAEEILPSLPSKSFSVVFSSPPYFNREKYSDDPTQSYLRFPTYEEWREQFLAVVLRQSFRLLENRGHLILNVANTGNFTIAADADEICRRYFGRPRVLRMLMASNPTSRATPSESKYRWEPIYVYRKA